MHSVSMSLSLSSPINSSPLLPHSSKPQLKSQMSLVSLQKSRKHIESETQQLANRILLLQREENQIWKNLEMAKTRAREVYLHKKRTIGREQERMHRYEREKKSTSLSCGGESAMLRKQREDNIRNLKDAIQKQKHDEMLMIKRQSQDCEKKIQETGKIMQQEKQNQMIAVKKQEILGSFKRKIYFEDKVTRIKNAQAKQLEEEEGYQLEKEMELQRLEKMERELLDRIKQTKDVQKQVFTDLGKILTNPNDETASEYFKQMGTPSDHGKLSTANKSNAGSLFDENASIKSQLIESFKGQDGVMTIPSKRQ